MIKERFRLLEGEKIYLIPIEEEHCDVYYSLLKNTSLENYKMTGTKTMFTKTSLKSYIEDIVSDRSRIDCFIVDRDNDEIVGEVVLNDIDWKNRMGCIRIAIFKDSDYNKGFGTEAMLLLIKYGFGMYNLNRIELEVYAFNERAIHLYEKIGFKREGILREYLYFDNEYHDAVTMSILKKEFELRRDYENSK